MLKAYWFTKNPLQQEQEHIQTRHADQQGRQANKAGGPTRQAGLQGRWADKTVGLTIGVPALTANIFAAATNRTNIYNKTGGMLH